MRIDELVKCVGMPYRQLDKDGNALGCMLPIYLLYPEIPKYAWPPQDNFIDYFMNLLSKHGDLIPIEEIQIGDVVAIRALFGFLHVGVYIGNDEIIHCMTGDSLEKCRLSQFSRRINGIFRPRMDGG